MNRPLPLLAFLAIAILPGCSLLGDGNTAKGGAEKGGAEKGGGQRAPSVVVGTAVEMDLVDRIEAVGTARANEQADLNSTVTERVAKVNFRDGQYVPRGAVIAELVRAEQGATLNESEARVREAQSQLERLKALQKQGFATRARVDEQQSLVDVARAQSAGARSQIGDRVIRAPFSGWLSLRRISPGQVVNSGTTVVTIVDHSRIKLDFPVPETYISALKPGLQIEAKAAAWPGEIFRGQVETIDPLVDPVSRAATARAILPNPDLRLRPGMLMTVSIQSRPRRSVVVPELAVVGDGADAYVWKVDAANAAHRTKIAAGTRSEGRVEVLSGLKAGDRLVTEGTVKLRVDGPIRPATAEDAVKAAA